MHILSSAEMRATDQRTAENFGVSLDALMENAGAAVARFCLREYAAAEKVVVLAGKGNNGGDGFVAARVLAAARKQVQVLLLGRADEVQGQAADALRRLRNKARGVTIREVLSADDVRDAIVSAELLVDAVVGTGFKPPLRGAAAALREVVEAASVPVVAVDLPSGWDA